jgi:hypothetical protein
MSLSSLYSNDYKESLVFKEHIAEFAEKARKELVGTTIYGVPLDIYNDRHVIVALYLMLKEYAGFHE